MKSSKYILVFGSFVCGGIVSAAGFNYSETDVVEILATERCVNSVELELSDAERENKLTSILAEKNIAFERTKLKEDQELYKSEVAPKERMKLGFDVIQKAQVCIESAKSKLSKSDDNHDYHYSDDEFTIIGAYMICAMGKVGNDEKKMREYLVDNLSKKDINFNLENFQEDQSYRKLYTDYHKKNVLKVMILSSECNS